MEILYRVFMILIITGLIGCKSNQSEDKRKIKELEKQTNELKQKVDSLSSPLNPIPKNDPPVVGAEIFNTKRYVFALFTISYEAPSGINQSGSVEYSRFKDTGVTNILEINDFTDEKKYRLQDLVRRQHILSRPPKFLQNQKIEDIQIIYFEDYSSTSKERQKIKYDHEIEISLW